MTEDVYQRLAGMFAEAPLGFSTTPAFLELLRLQYTPQEAELTVKMGFRALKLDQVHELTGIEKQELKKMLHTMACKGTMWITPGQEDPNYSPIREGGPGLIETGGWGNVRFPYSVQLMKALHTVQYEFATQRLTRLGFPTSRVWADPDALPEDADPSENVAEMMKLAGFWSVSTCSCRLPHWIADPGNHCTHLLEVCLLMGKLGRWAVEHGMAREISYEQALDILQKSNRDGLVHTYDPSNAVCNCCADCCVFLVGQKATGEKLIEPSPFVAAVDDEACTACASCADRCPVDAIEINACSVIDRDRCLGCGVCVPVCNAAALKLARRPKAGQPPAA